MNYLALVSDNTRSDDYVNATKWCQAFGKRWNNYSQARKPYIDRVSTKTEIQSTKVERIGRVKQTFVHPLVAVDLAAWLSDDFALVVNETFHRYLTGDITLADEILQRANAKDAEWLRDRADGKLARLEFTNELRQRGVGRQGFATNTNAIYQGLFGDTAAGLKETLAVANPREGMSKTELRALAFAESLAVDIMHKKNAHGNAQTTRCSSIAGNHVGNALEVGRH